LETCNIIMSGFLADADLSVNPIEAARLRLVGKYIDLTSSNPTAQGLLFPSHVLRDAAADFWDTRRHAPDPRGNSAARTAISAYYAARDAAHAPAPEQLLITASTSEAYSHLFALLCEPGDNVLGPSVTYPLFEHLAALHHVELRPYPLTATARGWSIDEAQLRATADQRTRAILIVSPHNPTGMMLKRAVAAFDALGLPLICDEVFAEFGFDGARQPLLAALHPTLPVFTLNGISKLFALPDLKLGWIALNAPAEAQFGARLELLNDAFLSANALTQHMLPALFAHGTPFVDAMRARVQRHLDIAVQQLSGHTRIDVAPPDGGYYLFPRISDAPDQDALIIALLEAGVFVHPGYFYGMEDETRIMISCLTEEASLREGLARLTGALS
jgi:alanine-synthesizing transaminase